VKPTNRSLESGDRAGPATIADVMGVEQVLRGRPDAAPVVGTDEVEPMGGRVGRHQHDRNPRGDVGEVLGRQAPGEHDQAIHLPDQGTRELESVAATGGRDQDRVTGEGGRTLGTPDHLVDVQRRLALEGAVVAGEVGEEQAHDAGTPPSQAAGRVVGDPAEPGGRVEDGLAGRLAEPGPVVHDAGHGGRRETAHPSDFVDRGLVVHVALTTPEMSNRLR
jgi:hypothetical protein